MHNLTRIISFSIILLNIWVSTVSSELIPLVNLERLWLINLCLTSPKPSNNNILYLDDSPLPPLTPDEQKRGFILFSRSYMRVLMKNAIPSASERINSLHINACPGEYEPATFSLHALRSLRDISIQASPLRGSGGTIEPYNIDIRSVRYMPWKGQGRWGTFQSTLLEDAPLLLEKRDSRQIEKNKNQTFWITVHTPDNLPPGRYHGNVNIKAGPAILELPLTVEVYPFKLAEPVGITFAMYARMRPDPHWIAETFADMRAHGLTTLALAGNSGLDMKVKDDSVVINFTGDSPLELNMQGYRKAGFTEPMHWLMSGDFPRICAKIGPLDSEPFARAYRQLILQLIEHGQASGWPEIIFQPVDEAFEHETALPRMLRLMQILKSIPHLRTEADGMNGKWHNFSEEAYRLTDVINLHDGPMLDRHKPVDMCAWWKFYSRAVNDSKLIWFYNIDLSAWHPEPVRFMTGFGLWKSRAHGIIEWAYMWPVKPEDSLAVYSQPSAFLYRYPAAPGISGGPTIGYEMVREGIDDYRYLLTLEKYLDRAYTSGNPQIIACANVIAEEIHAKIAAATFNGCRGVALQGNWTGKCEILPDGNRLVRGDHKIDNNWQFSDYQDLRHKIAAGIIQLQSLLH